MALKGMPFTTQWFESLSNNAKERMPWIVESRKGGIWRLYYRASTMKEANNMAIGLRDAKGKQPHKYAIRVVCEKTGSIGINLPSIERDIKEEESNK